MSGTFTFSPPDPSLSGPATPILVYKMIAPGDQLFPAPNCFCLQIDRREGPTPSVARFSYIMDDRAAAFGWPTQFDQLFPLDRQPSPYAFGNDDQIVVIALMGGLNPSVMFAGFAQSPQVDITGRSQQVTFIALGREVRAWDVPISYRVQRQNNALDNSVAGQGNFGTDIGTDTYVNLHAPALFNPQHAANCLPPNALPENPGQDSEHPIFADIGLFTNNIDANTQIPKPWDLAGASQYVLWEYNKDEEWVKNPTSKALKDLLVVKVPKGDFYDPNDSSTYDAKPLILPEQDITNTVWPEALHRMLAMHAFEMKFETYGATSDLKTALVIYRRDQAGPYAPKEVYLPQPGITVGGAFANAASIHLAWDLGSVRNAVDMEISREIFEESFILAPNFKPGPATDADQPNLKQFKLDESAKPGFDGKTYREFVAGDGNSQYWDYKNDTFKAGTLKTNSFYQGPDTSVDPLYQGPQTSAFLEPLRDLVAVDKKGATLDARLEVWRSIGLQPPPEGQPNAGAQVFGRDDEFTSPPMISIGPTGGQGVWDRIDDKLWSFLPGRMGIKINVENPTGLKTVSGATLDLIRGAKVAESDPKAYMFRLTVAMRTHERVPIYNGMRPASPTIYPRWVVPDRQNIYKINVQDAPEFDAMNTQGPLEKYVIDEYAKARDEGAAIRSRGEFPPLSGSVTIPAISLSYTIGDRIARINGRNISLRSNIGDQREAPQYPYVIGVSWDFSGDSQTTTLTLSDRRAENFTPAPAFRPRPMAAAGAGGMGGARRGRPVAGAIAGGLAALEGGRPRRRQGDVGDPNARRRGQPFVDKNFVGRPNMPGRQPPVRDENVLEPPPREGQPDRPEPPPSIHRRAPRPEDKPAPPRSMREPFLDPKKHPFPPDPNRAAPTPKGMRRGRGGRLLPRNIPPIGGDPKLAFERQPGAGAPLAPDQAPAPTGIHRPAPTLRPGRRIGRATRDNPLGLPESDPERPAGGP